MSPFGGVRFLLAAAPQNPVEALDQVRDRATQLGELVSGSDVVLVLLVLAITYYVIRASRFVLEALARRATAQRPVLLQLVAVVRISLWILAVYIIIVGIIQPEPESLIALWATIGVGVGLAAQDVLKNVFGGIVIMLDRPFKVGDLVDIGDHHGEVIGIGLRATQLRTRDDSVAAVPNAEVVRQTVLNANSGALDCMVVIELNVPSFADPLTVRKIAREAAITSPFVYAVKPISVQFLDEVKGNKFVTRAVIRAYVYDHRLEVDLIADVATRAKRGLIEAGIVPQEDVGGLERMREAREPAGAAGAAW
jgi:small-conductance mechanosensitive channel